ncbi:MAG: DNA polymerase III subunit delta [Firmicutes bacterium]|nr:DNA polymerase III subunit delta [Bacillota bacterium]
MQDWQKELAAGQVKPVYLFYGAERFLMHKALEQVTAAVAPGDNPFNLTRLNAETASLTELLGHANTLPFFTERKLIIVDNCPWFANRKKASETEETENAEPDLQELLTYLQNPAETTVLVFLAGESINKVKKLCKAAAKCGVVQEFAALKGNNAVLWLDGLLRQKGCNMQAAAKQQLLLYCDYDCTLINNELEKLSVYAAGQPEITKADVEAVVSSNVQASIFNLIDFVATGNLAQSLHALEQVVLNEAPESVLPRLADHFQTLYIVKGMQQHGYTVKEIMAASGKAHPFVIEKAGRQAAKYTEKKLQKALETLLTADKKFKSGISDIMDAIETAIIQICLLSR